MDKVENYDTENPKSNAFYNPKTKHDLAQHPNILPDRHIMYYRLMYYRRIRRSLRYYQSALATEMRCREAPTTHQINIAYSGTPRHIRGIFPDVLQPDGGGGSSSQDAQHHHSPRNHGSDFHGNPKNMPAVPVHGHQRPSASRTI
ncbi:hypothetical protein [Paracoccus aminovorans]|uniref:hypothetical protein n=1 Tax=Paracoccus aminovorans TaxID=34004 RepID=UPI0011136C9E|nr:hypothetical protein [Paracoccus aminovorans]